MKLRLLLTGVTLLGIASGCGERHAQDSQAATLPAQHVTLVTATATPLASFYEAMGTVRAEVSSTLQSKATGHVLAVLAKEGDQVKKGQVLLQLDAREAQAQLQRAQSALLESQEARREAERAVQAAVHAKEAAEAGDEVARVTFARFQSMADDGIASRQDLDEASARWKGATADTARAAEMIASAQARKSESEARIAQAQAEVTQAETLHSFAEVLAPYDGVVTRKQVEVGDLASPGMPLFQLEISEKYRLEVPVDESVLEGVHVGDAVPVALDANSVGNMEARVAEIVPAADAASRTFLVKIDLPVTEGVKSGLFGRARFKTGEKSALSIPVSAVVQRGQLRSVFVVGADQTARMRLVTLGQRHGEQVEVLSGLDGGEQVVTAGVEALADDTPVVQG